MSTLTVLRVIQPVFSCVSHLLSTLTSPPISSTHTSFDCYDLSSLRTGIAAGSPVPIEVMKRIRWRMHIKVSGGWAGMKKATGALSSNKLSQPALPAACSACTGLLRAASFHMCDLAPHPL